MIEIVHETEGLCSSLVRAFIEFFKIISSEPARISAFLGTPNSESDCFKNVWDTYNLETHDIC